jgi:hypothetical protein
MKRTRHQKGYVYRKGNLWLVRYYDSECSRMDQLAACKGHTSL